MFIVAGIWLLAFESMLACSDQDKINGTKAERSIGRGKARKKQSRNSVTSLTAVCLGFCLDFCKFDTLIFSELVRT